MFTSVSQEKRISRDGPDKIIWVLPEKIHIPVNRLESLQIILMGFPLPSLLSSHSFSRSCNLPNPSFSCLHSVTEVFSSAARIRFDRDLVQLDFLCCLSKMGLKGQNGHRRRYPRSARGTRLADRGLRRRAWPHLCRVRSLPCLWWCTPGTHR